jgi:hypothetical protein
MCPRGRLETAAVLHGEVSRRWVHPLELAAHRCRNRRSQHLEVLACLKANVDRSRLGHLGRNRNLSFPLVELHSR